jgi:hypothetical protein
MTHALAPALFSTLRRFLRPAHGTRERCDLCAADIPGEHSHVVDLATRQLRCTCLACSGVGQATGRYRAVSQRYAQLPPTTLSEAVWQQLGIPVDLVFFVVNSQLGRLVALYPGPAGTTESQLPLDMGRVLQTAHPLIAAMEPDVEALLVRKHAATFSAFLVPIDACYDLVGRMRAHWIGMNGGDRVRVEVDRLFASILRRSTLP